MSTFEQRELCRAEAGKIKAQTELALATADREMMLDCYRRFRLRLLVRYGSALFVWATLVIGWVLS